MARREKSEKEQVEVGEAQEAAREILVLARWVWVQARLVKVAAMVWGLGLVKVCQRLVVQPGTRRFVQNRSCQM